MSAERPAAAIQELTHQEARELSLSRTLSASHSWVRPFTPAEARYHAREFIAHNGRNNLVRLLAEAYLRDTGGDDA